MRIRIQLFTSMRIRILLIKVMLICDRWHTDPPGLHLSVHGPPRLHCKPRKFLNLDFNADSDPASKNKNNAGSGSETLVVSYSQLNMYLICLSPLMRYFIFSLACKTGRLQAFLLRYHMSVICDEFGYVQWPKVKRSDRKTIISNWINVMVPDPVSTIRNQGNLYTTVLFIFFCRKNWRIKRQRGKRGGNATSRWWARIQTIQLVLTGYWFWLKWAACVPAFRYQKVTYQ